MPFCHRTEIRLKIGNMHLLTRSVHDDDYRQLITLKARMAGFGIIIPKIKDPENFFRNII